MMKHEEIIEALNEIDQYLIKNVSENGKLQNSEEIYARIYIGNVQKIKKYLEQNRINGAIKNRVEQTENALLYATSRQNLNKGNQYFSWIKSKKQQKKYAKPNEVEIYYDIITGHQPIVWANYAKEYLPQVLGIEEIIHNMEIVEQEYNDFLNQDKSYEQKQETALTTVKKKKPIQRFFDKILKRGDYSKKQQPTHVEKDTAHVNEYYEKHREYCDQLSNYENYSNDMQGKDIQNKRHVQQQEKTIAISDLHGNMEKWERIKSYMKINPNMKVLILGDAMDRGEYGLEILLQIKELCDQGKAEYLPGNHDIFAYNYVKTQDMLSKLTNSQKMQNEKIVHIAGRELAHLQRNGGETTLESLENFDRIVKNEIKNGNIKNNISKKELIDWLGHQPIQKKTNINNTTYALAHAWFDAELYNSDKNFNLEKALQLELYGREDDKTLQKFRTAMWYRKEDERTHYSQVKFPEGCVMVVGHTVQEKGIGVKNFTNDKSYKPVIYIDTGKNTSALDLSTGEVLEYHQYDEVR